MKTIYRVHVDSHIETRDESVKEAENVLLEDNAGKDYLYESAIEAKAKFDAEKANLAAPIRREWSVPFTVWEGCFFEEIEYDDDYDDDLSIEENYKSVCPVRSGNYIDVFVKQ
ncbi:MAG: hypothetical protein IKU30_04810 [Clostridia bacterium]|nr:hypothetical protein [Clostridia bacterium]